MLVVIAISTNALAEETQQPSVHKGSEASPEDAAPWTAEKAARVDDLAREATRLLLVDKDFEGAFRKRSEIVEFHCDQLGEDHWRTAASRTVCRDLQRYCEFTPNARKQLCAALELNSSAHEMLKNRQYAAASIALKQALVQIGKVAGPNDTQFADVLAALVIAERGLGDLKRARAAGQQSCVVHKAVFGERSPFYAMTLNLLAELELRLQLCDSAEAHLIEAEQIYRKSEGVGCQPHVCTLCMLALLKIKQGDQKNAVAYAQRAYPFITFSTGAPPEDPRPEAAHLYGAALILSGSENPFLAVELLAHVLEMDDAPNNPTPPGTMATYYQSYARVLNMLGREDESARVAEIAKALWREHLHN